MIDSHCHLATAPFDADRAVVLQRAWDAGVQALILIGAGDGMAGNEAAIQLAATDPRLYASVGLHPHDAAHCTDDTIPQLRQLAQHPRVVAIGEAGLDYHYEHAPRPQQRQALEAQLALAHACDLPIVIHQREAEEDFLAIMRAYTPTPRGVMHCFTGSLAFARACLDLGFYLSLPGVITFRKTESLRAVVRQLPRDRLLLETDSPYLAPVPYRGKRNEPAFLVETARVAAELCGCSLEEFTHITTANCERLFALHRDR